MCVKRTKQTKKGKQKGYISWWALSWPGLASVWLNYVELIWRLHSVCQVSTAIIMQLWSFILSRPTVHPHPRSAEMPQLDFFFLLPHSSCASCFSPFFMLLTRGYCTYSQFICIFISLGSLCRRVIAAEHRALWVDFPSFCILSYVCALSLWCVSY